uniref:Sugar transporter SWEET1 n=1 Tax=Entomoneis paludosa TaxID=265537 RepID=A0A6U3BHM4_9STRA|mmetsp:Transcript_30463/g.63612  ORF Transcript_30463/g.63612 Transcript_30463/m.63612 type:complete len:320 (+) Transcript_30463:302-1261(+)|eukprot:CAMPEP_0172448458 /NCGR_PEP_ID=MMETSP1065-20121228/7475_1 /TAXON_ID=265537 /ORGANISM="Amphiprora paludosa, Strain CCMP125" /LENGTH=319 /DNA_ID=CAMNT_0013199963 /DNA_START=278 /DNA_END=1237 /DNA_ORIENTATION=+
MTSSASVGTIFLEYVCPIGGIIAANIMFFAPVRDVWNQTKNIGVLGDLNPTPWAFMLGNCFGWVAYSVLTQDLFVFFANAPGLLLSVWLNMAAVQLQFQDKHQKQQHAENATPQHCVVETSSSSFQRWVVRPHDVGNEALAMVIVTLWLVVVSFLSFGQNMLSQDNQELLVGITVNVNLVFFYGAPLSTIATVWKTKSCASIHVPTMITNTTSAVLWFAYGLVLFDMFIAVPNFIGVVLGATQIFLCLRYPRTIPQKHEEEHKRLDDAISDYTADTLVAAPKSNEELQHQEAILVAAEEGAMVNKINKNEESEEDVINV